MNAVRTVVVATAMAIGAAPSAALSEGKAAIEEIIVTATKREQALQDIPVAVSVTTGEVLAKAHIDDILQLQTVVPSLRVTQLQTSTQTNFVIRGFGNGANNPGVESSVGVFIDGVYRSRSASQIGDLVDVERVEVLRGPQSTLFGQNASAGIISVTTRKPSFEPEGSVEATLGNRSSRQARARVSGPLGKTVAASLSGNISKRDGYFTNLTNGHKLNDQDRYDLRGQLLWLPSDDLSVRLIADTGHIDERCCGVVNLLNGPTGALVQAVGGKIYTGDAFDRKAYLNRDPENVIDNDGVSLNLNYTTGSFRIDSITAYRKQKLRFNYDADFTSADLVPTNDNDQKLDTFTQELRLTFDNGGPLTGLFGAYYFDESVDYDNTIGYGRNMRGYANGLVAAATGNPNTLAGLEAALGLPVGATFFQNGQSSSVFTQQDNKAYTLYSQFDWTPVEKLTLTGGLAYTKSKKTVNLEQSDTDVFSSLNLVQVGFGGAFAALTGGLPPTPANIGARPAQAALADRVSVTACSASNPPPLCNAALGLYPLQFLYPVVPYRDGKSNDDKLTYTARAAYQIDEAMKVYAGISTGYKATSWNLSRDSRPFQPAVGDRSPLGGFPNPYYGRYGTRFAGPEESTVIEAGFKGKWSTAALYVAVFRQELKGFQSNTFTGTGFSLTNAGKQSTKGVEIEAEWLPTERLELVAGGTFLHPRYDSFVGGPGVNGPTDLSGTRPRGISTTSVTLAATYHWQIGGMPGFVRADYRHDSKVAVVENVPGNIAPRKVNSLDASIGVERSGWEAMLWGRNLTDDNYLLSAFPSVAQNGSYSGYTNAPRSYGVTLRREF